MRHGLILLLIVLVLLGIMSSLQNLPRSREAERRSICIMNMKYIWRGLVLYATDNQNNFPDDLSKLYPRHIQSAQYFFCPDYLKQEKQQITNTNLDGSYIYVSGQALNGPENSLILYDRGSNHKDGRNALFLGGHVKWFPYYRPLRLNSLEVFPSTSMGQSRR